ncbi:MAG: peptide chain release factor N(5)-glutamine methyltransferase [Planctomycetota bacterium]
MSDAERAFTVLDVLKASEAWLEKRGVDAPRRSAELLLGHVLGLDRLHLYLAHDRPMSGPERDRMRALLRRRGAHEPVAYLIGSWSFFGLDLEVAPAVLVPRPETEMLVELAFERIPEGGRVVDLGTGSGAIALAIAARRPDAKVLATDISEEALRIARSNAARLGLAVTFREGSWWEACAGEWFDVVVSNPPYVDPSRPDLLGSGVAEFEPSLALFTPSGDPAASYRALIAGLPSHLVAGGSALFETGVGAAEAALEAMRRAPFLGDVEVRSDPAGLPRVLLARMRAP